MKKRKRWGTQEDPVCRDAEAGREVRNTNIFWERGSDTENLRNREK